MNSYFTLNAWTVDQVIKGLTTSVKGWVAGLGILAGAVAFGFAVWFLVKAVTSKQERGKRILESIFALVIAALLGGSSMKGLDSIQQGMSDSVTKIGGGTGTGAGNNH